MIDYFAWDYTGTPFRLFSMAHLAALAVIAGLALLLPLLRGRPSAQVWFRYGLATLLLVNEMSWHVWHWVNGQWTVQTMLPLHLCSVLVFGSAIMLVTRHYGIFEFAYFMGIAGALQALFTPDLTIHGFPHYRFWQTYISHGGIVLAALFMVIVVGYRPTWRSLWHVLIGMNVYLAFVGIVNWLLGSNYMFIAHKPETASLLDVLGPWPWYILSLEALGMTICLLLMLPFVRRRPGVNDPHAQSLNRPVA
ncbi:TIGR02206 family membrane protein [bacterium]|nr:TIGR02206 family membrane protein [bacterium]